ncbi:MAG: peptide chain release factor N(5)-glutamine methyltransferase [Pseudomonadota bacterium]|nr:peptide chain release factor N(5)-glutamine methyltransferase [Pseudomonadota bacterium]
MNALKLINFGSNELKYNNIRTHKLDSELLLSKILNKKREEIIANLKQKIDLKKINEFNKLIYRRSLQEPMAYIINEKEFWSKKFEVNTKTLIPRPETELMLYNLIRMFSKKSISILDIGTGSGCILISLLGDIINAKGIGIDISEKALNIAKKNALNHGVLNRVKFFKRSISNLNHLKFDLIVSNPPYIQTRDLKNLDDCIKKYEPKIALDGGNDGLDVIKKDIYKACKILRLNGLLAIEIGNGQYKKVSNILLKKLFRIEYNIKDYGNNTRCLIARKINY